jgi:hypothetical protein
MDHWNPDTPEFENVQKTIEGTSIGRTPERALDIVGVGIERAVRAGVTPDKVKDTVDLALTRAEQLTGSSGR